MDSSFNLASSTSDLTSFLSRAEASALTKKHGNFDKNILAGQADDFIFKLPPEPSYVGKLRDYYRQKTFPDLSKLHIYRNRKVYFEHTMQEPRSVLREPKCLTRLKGKSFLKREIGRAYADIGLAAKLLADFGVHTQLARREIDFDLEAATRPARGYRDGETSEFSPASYQTGSGIITILQQHRHRPALDFYIAASDPYFYQLHEFGHAISDSLSLFMNQPPENLLIFIGAYFTDLKNLNNLPEGPPHLATEPFIYKNAETGQPIAGFRYLADLATSNGVREELAYYLTKQQGGRHQSLSAAKSECWAELYAAKMAKGTSVTNRRSTQLLIKYFPHTVAAVDSIVRALDDELARDPNPETILQTFQLSKLPILEY